MLKIFIVVLKLTWLPQQHWGGFQVSAAEPTIAISNSFYETQNGYAQQVKDYCSKLIAEVDLPLFQQT